MRNYITRGIKTILQSIKKKHTKPLLGRWSLEYGDKAGKRADMTNEDHCGVCSNLREDYIREDRKKIK